MRDIRRSESGGVLDIAARHLGPAQAKWDRLTVSDYTGIKSVGELIAAVESRYSLPHDQATRDVEIWLRDIGLRE